MASMPRPLTFPIKKLIGFDAKLWKQVQEYRFDARFNTESDAVRHLIEVGLKARLAAPSSGSSGGARKPRSTGKRTTPRKGPERKAAPSSKLDQIRALREQGTH
jgi:hypothetical protein